MPIVEGQAVPPVNVNDLPYTKMVNTDKLAETKLFLTDLGSKYEISQAD
jgi:hypothetical protein